MDDACRVSRGSEGCGIYVRGRFAVGLCFSSFFFFFQAEDGIRDVAVTGVQTCALPISGPVQGRLQADSVSPQPLEGAPAQDLEECSTAKLCGGPWYASKHLPPQSPSQIGRASCRERV